MIRIYKKSVACTDQESPARDDGRCAKRGIIVGDFNDLFGGSVDKKTKQKGF
jgi:hypothetical protein